jgi:hypothetical protein
LYGAADVAVFYDAAGPDFELRRRGGVSARSTVPAFSGF